VTPTRELAGFLAKYDPSIARQARAALRTLRALVPGALELVYDNYNALAIGFSPTERTSDAVVSIALYPRWVSLFFLQDGPKLPDPTKILRGSGARVRHVVLTDAKVLGSAPVKALIREALARAKVPFDPKAKGRIVIKSVSKKQRPRRA
jgi:hypothetical protein